MVEGGVVLRGIGSIGGAVGVAGRRRWQFRQLSRLAAPLATTIFGHPFRAWRILARNNRWLWRTGLSCIGLSLHKVPPLGLSGFQLP